MKMGVILGAVVLLAASVANGEEVPSLHSCEISAAAVGPSEFVPRALGGDSGCATAADKSACCMQIQGLFSRGGAAELCMCNKDFFSVVLGGLTFENGVTSDDYVDMLVECGIPVAGRSSCPGVAEDRVVEPVVQSQFLTSLVLAKLLGGGAAAKPPAPKPAAPKPKPAPKPARTTQTPKTGGKKGAPVKTFVPSKKGGKVAPPRTAAPVAMVMTPVAAPAPVPVAAPAPVGVPAPVAAPIAAPAPVPVATPAPAFRGSFSGGSR